MTDLEQPYLSDELEELSVRQLNIFRSLKKNGSAYIDSQPYLNELGIEIIESPQPIKFQRNVEAMVHRWSPYVQGFSAEFVQRTLDYYRRFYMNPIILDPFAGSGTVLVQAKLNNMQAYGVELNPLLHFVSRTKIRTWSVSPDKLQQVANTLSRSRRTFSSPVFLKSERHFNPGVLRNLEILKSGIDGFNPNDDEDVLIKDMLLVAFSSILVDSSNLKRSPCLGYSRTKKVDDSTPFILFDKKIRQMVQDLRQLQTYYRHVTAPAEVYLANSKEYRHHVNYDLVITSPPYMNGLDYVINYKIEMGWLGFADGHQELKRVKDAMVVCDNVSKGLIKGFSRSTRRYSNEWLENIKSEIAYNIEKRGNYRRLDMPEIVHKYFDDMYRIMQQISVAIRSGGRFILVVGDSLIADVYLPTDLLLARIGMELGFSIEKIEKARERRSGQIRSYKLRETIVTLKKV